MNHIINLFKNIVKFDVRQIHVSTVQFKAARRGWIIRNLKVDEGNEGEKNIDYVNELNQKNVEMFPTKDLYNRLYFGVPFKELPICNIRVTKNNTIFSLTDYRGNPRLITSCGIEGFKNARKGTNVAAQTTAINFTIGVIEKGIKNVRVCIRGLGPGRMSSIKGLQMGGLNVISITDTTRVTWRPQRARKQRRV